MAASLKRRVLTGGAWVGLGKVVTALSTVLILSLLARLMPQEQVGVYLQAERLIWWITMIGLQGTNVAVVRLVAESISTGQPGRARAVVRRVFAVAGTGVGVVALVLLLGAGPWLAGAALDSPGLAAVIALVVLWGAVHAMQVLTSETFRGLQELHKATLFGGVITSLVAVTALGGAAVMKLEFGAAEVILILGGASALSLLAGLLTLRRRVRALGSTTPLARRTLLGVSMPLWINTLLAYGLTQSDLLILGLMRPDADVAIYGAAARLVSVVLMSLMLVNLVVPPFIAELYARGERRRLERMLRLTATVAGVPAAGVLALYLAFGGPLLAAIYSEGYRDGAWVLALLSLARMVHVAVGSAAMTLSMTGHQNALLRITAVTSVVTVSASLWLVRLHGAIGVAAAVAGGIAVQQLAVWLSARYYTGMWTHVTVPTRTDLRDLLHRGPAS